MKRKLIALAPCAVAALVVVLVFSGRDGRRRAVPPTQSLVVTQAGKLTLVPNPAGYATMTVVMDIPKPGTNVSSRAIDPGK
jgi:hypothetical protein